MYFPYFSLTRLTDDVIDIHREGLIYISAQLRELGFNLYYWNKLGDYRLNKAVTMTLMQYIQIC